GQLVNAFNSMLETIQQQNRALVEVNENLESVVESRTAELKLTNKELEAFTYSVSHDLRSPLRSIDGFSAALLEDCGSQLDQNGLDYLTRMRAASQRMGKLIDSLLYLSRVSRQDMVFKAVDLSEIALEIGDGLKVVHPNRDVQLVVPDCVMAYGDRDLLYIVLDNLLRNAWKYTSKKVHALIELGSREQRGETVFFVRDNGAGFDMKYADKLFGPFQRLHRSEEFEGLGIGLATVARIVHRHGGEIWAEGKVDEGAVFYFTLGSIRNEKSV
ncbi:MAG: GHKL domain-containing protein, partial [Pseudomonadales bacterium]|nr:GHKL domain-containing protein [Pseudomonadales bacterium]